MPWPQFMGRQVIWTYRGRVANMLACRYLGLKPGDEVLMPAYNCGTEVDPFLRFGVNVVLYRVDLHANIDINDIRRRVTKRTRMLYITHYLGWPQELAELAVWCREKDIRLVEDCALSLFSRGADGPIGTIGDAAIYSFYKTLPLPHGGALVLKECKSPQKILDKRPNLQTLISESIPLVKHSLYGMADTIGAYSLIRRLLSWSHCSEDDNGKLETFPDMPKNYYFSDKIADWGPSRIVRGVLAKTNPEQIIEIRRRNYLYLLEALGNTTQAKPLFNNLPQGVCPLLFPILVSDRGWWFHELGTRGIKAVPWWAGYNKRLSWKEFSEAQYLKDHLLVLPIHQGIDTRHIQYMAKTLQVIAGLTPKRSNPATLTKDYPRVPQPRISQGVYNKKGNLVRIIYLIIALVWWILSGFGRFKGRETVVLCYHGINPSQRKRFEWQMKQVAARTCEIIWPEKKIFPKWSLPRVGITFDDAFHSIHENAIPILRNLNIPATVFAVAGNLGKKPLWKMPPDHPEKDENVMSGEEIIKLQQKGFCRFGSHTLTHPNLEHLPPRELEAELVESKVVLEKLLDAPVEDLALPHGSYNQDVISMGLKAGYTRIFTLESYLNNGTRRDGVWGRFSMSPDAWKVEFLLTCAGAYAWLYPWRKVVRGIRTLFTQKVKGRETKRELVSNEV